MAEAYFAPAASAMPVDREALRDAWIALLGRWEWEWFCTFTFRDMVHPEAADKRFRVLISQANRVLYGHRWHKQGRGLRWVRALEYQKREVIHYHALIAGVQDLRRLYWPGMSIAVIAGNLAFSPSLDVSLTSVLSTQFFTL